MLAVELRKKGYGISTRRSVRAIAKVCEQLKFPGQDELFAAIGSNKLSPKSVANKVEQILEEGSPAQIAAAEKATQQARERQKVFTEDRPMLPTHAAQRAQRDLSKRQRNSCGVVVKDDPDLLVQARKKA